MEGFTVGPAALHLLNNRSFSKKVAEQGEISPNENVALAEILFEDNTLGVLILLHA